MEVGACPRVALFDRVGWSSERNFNRHLNELREEGWLDWRGDPREVSWVPALTASGKSVLLDNIDPEDSWSRPWDKRWRSLSFDLPQAARRERRQLDVWLRKRRFGHLQGSVWISHRPYGDWTHEMETLKIDARSVLFQDSVPLGRNGNSDYVASAWNFDLINSRYRDYLSFLGSAPSGGAKASAGDSRANWLQEESRLWRKAFELDPFLPYELLPAAYLGTNAWSSRKKAYRIRFREWESQDA